MRRLAAALLLLGLATPAAAEPLRYQLDAARSRVSFEADFTQGVIRGQMPVRAAELVLDFDRAAASRVRVTLDPAAARANIPFATEALKGSSVLDTRRFPEILFESTAVRATPTGATIAGRITIRGVTRMVMLDARLYRPEGSQADERDALSVLLTGSVPRSAFGASGFPDMVGDVVRLKILARIRRAG